MLRFSWLLFLGLPGLCSCATWRHVDFIEVSLIDVRIQNATVLETVILATVRVENEDPKPLDLRGAVHKIYLNGSYLGKGMTSEPLQVPGLGTATQQVTVYLRNLSMASRVRSIVHSQELEYRLKSTLYTAEPGARRLGTSNEGRLNLQEFQRGPSPTY